MPPLGFAKGGHKFFKGGNAPPRGAVKYPERVVARLITLHYVFTPLLKKQFESVRGNNHLGVQMRAINEYL